MSLQENKPNFVKRHKAELSLGAVLLSGLGVAGMQEAQNNQIDAAAQKQAAEFKAFATPDPNMNDEGQVVGADGQTYAAKTLTIPEGSSLFAVLDKSGVRPNYIPEILQMATGENNGDPSAVMPDKTFVFPAEYFTPEATPPANQ